MNVKELKTWLESEFDIKFSGYNRANINFSIIRLEIAKHGYGPDAPIRLNITEHYKMKRWFRVSKKRPDLRCEEVKQAILEVLEGAKEKDEAYKEKLRLRGIAYDVIRKANLPPQIMTGVNRHQEITMTMTVKTFCELFEVEQ